ncbi:MAG: Holliday junction resolvase RuvX, partial [Thermomicrobium sp.]
SAAERLLVEAGVRRGRRRQLVDAVAAALMLQSYLDAQRAGQSPGKQSRRQPDDER